MESTTTHPKVSINRNIFRAFLTIGSITLGVKLVSMVKDSIVAASFGTGSDMDAFLVAFLIPSFIIQVVAGSFNAALIPTYIRIRESEGHSAAERLFSGTVAMSVALLLVISAGLMLTSPYLFHYIASGFGAKKLALTQALFYMLLPSIAINGVATVWGAVLNAEERFKLTSIAPVIVPLITAVFLFTKVQDWGVYVLVYSTVLGFLAHLCLLACALKERKLSLWPRWHGYTPAMQQVMGQYVPTVAASILMSGTLLIDQSMASHLGSGSVATLNYANKFVAVVTGVGTIALGTAVLPYFSKMVAKSDWIGIRNSLKVFSRLILVTTVPLALIACILSKFIVELLFQRGNFTAADTLLVSRVQIMYLLQVPFFALGILFVRLISALKANHILLWGTLISFTLNITLDYVLMHYLGVSGIALSTALVYVVSCTFLGFMLFRTLKRIEVDVSQCA